MQEGNCFELLPLTCSFTTFADRKCHVFKESNFFRFIIFQYILNPLGPICQKFYGLVLLRFSTVAYFASTSKNTGKIAIFNQLLF